MRQPWVCWFFSIYGVTTGCMRKGRNNGLAVAKQKDNNYFTEIYYIPSDFDVLLITKQRLIIIDSLHYL